jgi:hypothetical protein
MEFFIIFGIVVVPLFLLGLFAVYKSRKLEEKERRTAEELKV